MKNSKILKSILLSASLISLVGCSNEEVPSSSSTSTSQPIVNQHKPGDTVMITEENFFTYFTRGVMAPERISNTIKYNIDSEIVIKQYNEYYCPSINDTVESYTERLIESSLVSDEEYKNGKSSHFETTSDTSHFVVPSSWGSNHYTYTTYKIEYEFKKISGVITYGVDFFDADVIELSKENYLDYEEYLHWHYKDSNRHGDKTTIGVNTFTDLPDGLDYASKTPYIENLKVDLEFASYDAQYTKLTTTNFSVTTTGYSFYDFTKTTNWLASVKKVSGLLYIFKSYSN